MDVLLIAPQTHIEAAGAIVADDYYTGWIMDVARNLEMSDGIPWLVMSLLNGTTQPNGVMIAQHLNLTQLKQEERDLRTSALLNPEVILNSCKAWLIGRNAERLQLADLKITICAPKGYCQRSAFEKLVSLTQSCTWINPSPAHSLKQRISESLGLSSCTLEKVG